MSHLEQIESEIAELSRDDLAVLRRWFADFDANAWDRQFEADAKAGKLDRLAADALKDHATGRSTQL